MHVLTLLRAGFTKTGRNGPMNMPPKERGTHVVYDANSIHTNQSIQGLGIPTQSYCRVYIYIYIYIYIVYMTSVKLMSRS